MLFPPLFSSLTFYQNKRCLFAWLTLIELLSIIFLSSFLGIAASFIWCTRNANIFKWFETWVWVFRKIFVGRQMFNKINTRGVTGGYGFTYSFVTPSMMTMITYNLQAPSWSSSYVSFIDNYLCNQCISPQTMWVRITLMRGVVDTTLCDNVFQWLPADQCTPVSSTNKTDRHDIIEISLQVALSIITLTHTVYMTSRCNVSWCNATDVWSSCRNLLIHTSKILLRRILSLSVKSYHERYDAHDSSVQSADNWYIHWHVVYH
jgi:hypothetical protein